jgi:hypothetical protein
LVASEGSTEFNPVSGQQIESGGCRIIAGSHRFVAVVEAPDSVIEPTLSGEDQTEIWSDVDSEDNNGGGLFFDSFPEPEGEAANADVPPAQATIPSPRINADKRSNSVTKPAFSMSDAINEAPEDSSSAKTARPETTSSTASSPQKSAKPDNQGKTHQKTDKKLFFPIEDDFFD